MNLALSLLAAAAAAAAQPTVVTADGDWSELPSLEQRDMFVLSSTAMQRLYEITEERTCRLPGQSYRQLNLRLSFAAQFERDGSLKQIVLPKLNCPEAEGILGGALVDMIRKGSYRPKAASELGWYRGNLAFGFEG